VDADAFVDFYESKGWLVGKNKMKDWKAAVRTWERNRDQQGFRSMGNSKKPAITAVNNLAAKYAAEEGR
jgi:hypothetical protein